MTFLFFDTETTGLPGVTDPQYGHTHSSDGQPRFVELAWLKMTDGKRTGGCDMFVRPSDFLLPEAAGRINGITLRTLAERGLEEELVLHAFMLAVRNADVLVGHNIEFDLNVIASRLCDLNMQEDAALLKSKRTVCTMLASTKLCKLPKVPGKHYDYGGKYKWPRLQELHLFLFGEEFDGAHGAMADTEATARCFTELVKRKIIKIKQI